MKTGLVLEGGAFRGLFSAGVLDFLIENNQQFDYVVGVSAGSGNQLNFIAGQKGRTKKIIQADGKDKYFGVKQFFENGKILDLHKMTFGLAYGKTPFDFDAYKKSNVEGELVIMNCETGKAEYVKKSDDEDRMLTAAMASCSVPILCKPVEMDGNNYLDGSVADSIPVQRAVDMGCDRILVVLTRRPEDKPTNFRKYKAIMGKYKKHYPGLYEALLQRTKVYDEQRDILNKYIEEGKAFVIRPDMPSISKFEKSKEKQEAFYQHGYDIMKSNYDELIKFLNN